MVNLSTFKIRITGTIPKKFRILVEDYIYMTFLQELIDYTRSFKKIDSMKLWKVEYEPWHGFVIKASDTKNNPYAHIIKWINYGTSSHFIKAKDSEIYLDKVGREVFIKNPNKLKFLCFDDLPRKKRMERIEGNIVFKKNGKVFALVVEHPGIEAKRFIDDILDDDELNYDFMRGIVGSDLYSNSSIDIQKKILDSIKMNKRQVLGINSE